MKKINKLFVTLMTATSTVVPCTISLASCSQNNNYDTLANQIKDVAINEFLEITKVPRPSRHCTKIFEYLKKKNYWFEFRT